MRPYLRLFWVWVLLMALWVLEFGASYLHVSRALRPILVLPSFLMAALIAVVFMRVGSGPTIVRGFAIAALFWLTILLGLGTSDLLTRTVYSVPVRLTDYTGPLEH